ASAGPGLELAHAFSPSDLGRCMAQTPTSQRRFFMHDSKRKKASLPGSRKGFTRRQVLEGLGWALGAGAVAIGCGDDSRGGPARGDAMGPGDAGMDHDGSAKGDAAQPPDAGSQCNDDSEFGARAMLERIDTIVVLMMENRS